MSVVKLIINIIVLASVIFATWYIIDGRNYFWEQKMIALHGNPPNGTFDLPTPYLINFAPEMFQNCRIVDRSNDSMVIECRGKESAYGYNFEVPRGFRIYNIPNNPDIERIW